MRRKGDPCSCQPCPRPSPCKTPRFVLGLLGSASHNAFLLLSLVLVTALLSPLPAQARQPGHYWQITYTDLPPSTLAYLPQGGYLPPFSANWPAGSNGSGVYVYTGDLNASVTGTVVATLTWIATNGNMQADPPPKQVYIAQTGYASENSPWNGLGLPPSGAGSALDGLSDPALAFGTGLVSKGKHLIQRDGSSGLIVLDPVTVSAINPVSVKQPNGSWNWGVGANSVSLTVAVDTRVVTITSSLGQTYHRELDATQKPIRVADVAAADGTAKATTLRPAGSGLPISYFVHAYGNWTNGSRYLLHCSSGDPGGSNYGNGDQATITGQFFLPADPICFLTMHYGTTATSEHAYAHLIDYGDGADGTANEYVTFHTKYEDWYKDLSKTIDHPLPLVSKGVVNASGDWVPMFIIDNNSPSPLTQSLKQDITLKKTMQGTIGGQVSGPIEAATFQANESITIGSETSKTFSVDTTFTGHAFTRTQFYEGQSWEERAGTCSVWVASGYQNEAIWNGVYAPSPAVASPGTNVTFYYPGYKP